MRGVNLFVPHAFYYCIEGKRRDERPPDVGPHSIWWPHYRRWALYMSRLSALMTDAEWPIETALLCWSRECPRAQELPGIAGKERPEAPGRALADWGIEGVHYTLDENGGAVSSTESSSLSSAPYQGLNQAVGYIPYTLEGQVEATMDEPRKASKEVMTMTAEYAVFNPAEAYLTVSPTFSLNGTILAQTINDARTQFITGAIDWSGFEKAVATWEAQGGAALKAEVNEAYHAG